MKEELRCEMRLQFSAKTSEGCHLFGKTSGLLIQQRYMTTAWNAAVSLHHIPRLLSAPHPFSHDLAKTLPSTNMAAATPVELKYYELYRRSTVGAALTDTLDNLITQRRIEPQLAMRVLANFDKAVADVLAEEVKARLSFKVSDTIPATLTEMVRPKWCD